MIKVNETLLETYFETEKLTADSFMQENKLAGMKKDECKQGDKPTLREVLDPSNC